MKRTRRLHQDFSSSVADHDFKKGLILVLILIVMFWALIYLPESSESGLVDAILDIAPNPEYSPIREQ